LSSETELTEKLEISRKELLDLGLRNSLLSFRPSARSLEVVDELHAEVYRILVDDSKAMSFLSIPESEAGDAENFDELTIDFDELYGESSEENALATRHTDTKLQTRRTPEVLQRTLLKIYTEAKGFIEEQGINVLYLSIGFLEWYEDDNSQIPRKAPLLLLPVELTRGNAKEAFKVNFSGEDLEPNLSLEAKLKAEFGVVLPGFPEDSLDAGTYFSEVGEAVSSKKRWVVNRDEMQLGFFSFGKFRMYKDLDPDIWPEDHSLLTHEVIGALLGDGFKESEPRFQEGERLDDHIDPAEVHFVKDADSTQTIAALEVMTGKHMVIQGPPGTGKSQTITNIIAECIGQDKTVLFVAEKMAALEVVKRRLDEVHIGDGVLELHSHKSNKKLVIQELGRTLNLGKPIVNDGSDDLDAFRQSRDRLNRYCQEANEPVLSSGVSFVDALGFCLQIKKKWSDLPRFDFELMKNWTASFSLKQLAHVQEVADYVDENGTPSRNPFFASDRRSFSPTHQANLNEQISIAATEVEQLELMAGRLAQRLGFSLPMTIGQCRTVCRAALRACEAPQLTDVAIERDEWQKQRDEIRAMISAGELITTARRALEEVLIDAAWSADLRLTRQALMAYGGKWWRVFSGEYRRAKKELLGLCRTALPADDASCLEVVDTVLDAQANQPIFEKSVGLGKTLFGSHWQGIESDWEVLSLVSDWIISLYDDIGQGEVPESILEFLSGELNRQNLDVDSEVTTKQADKVEKRLGDLRQEMGISAGDVGEQSLAEIGSELTMWHERLGEMYQLVRYRQLQDQLTESGLQFVLGAADEWELPGTALLDSIKLTFYEGLVNEAYENRPAINRFDRTAHANQIEKFRDLDQLQMIHAQGKLALKHFEGIPRLGGSGQVGIISHELNKKRRHLPIRKLIKQAGLAIQQFKPVFMMSPMSIAQYLEPGSVTFDVVIFDEASQVKTVDAFGAISRGKQIVVVGDTKQMPPTDFFGRGYEGDEDEESATGDIESVLGLFLARGAPQAMLKWHYRSRHESLIAVSNYEFYENKLVVFPSSGSNTKASGLHFHHLPDTVYDRGKSRTNKEEARAVAEAVMEHARQQPDLTLGVVAFSTAQRDSILFHLDQLRRSDDSGEAFFADHPDEPFFVKNLENVQGDERDVIMISIGYGKDAAGRVSPSFGPVNREGGQRRLNVLISRAKQVMHVFANFTGDDLKVTSSSPFGVKALQHFLKYAQNRQLDVPLETGKLPDSPFEEEVISALRDAGYDIEPQVGTAGYFIDLAVRDPDRPGAYLLAIECDGAAYHSSLSARDRDRLRQSVLEGLGWRFHRIWSTDWFRNPASELVRVREAIENAKQSVNLAPETKTSTAHVSITRAADSAQEDKEEVLFYTQSILPAVNSSTEFHETSRSVLARMIETVVTSESPVHIDQVTRRLMEAFEITRAGARVQQAMKEAISSGVRNNLFRASRDFLYCEAQEEYPIRNRANLESAEKKPLFVAPEEWDSAIRHVVSHAFQISGDDLVSDTLSMLGFKRATSAAADIVWKRVNELARTQIIQVKDERYSLSP
jgi:very-short-patch-repair endonuclease